MALEIIVETLTSHRNDQDDAHDASAISFEPEAGLTSTNVQGAIVEAAQVAASLTIPDGSITEVKLAFDPVTHDELVGVDFTPDSYYHVQIAASAFWVVTHNLDFYPNVTVIDSAGTVIIGDVNYLNANTVTISFSAPFSGRAYLS